MYVSWGGGEVAVWSQGDGTEEICFDMLYVHNLHKGQNTKNHLSIVSL